MSGLKNHLQLKAHALCWGKKPQSQNWIIKIRVERAQKRITWHRRTLSRITLFFPPQRNVETAVHRHATKMCKAMWEWGYVWSAPADPASCHRRWWYGTKVGRMMRRQAHVLRGCWSKGRKVSAYVCLRKLKRMHSNVTVVDQLKSQRHFLD